MVHSSGNTRCILARALSKLGLASRSEARALISDGRVRVNGRVERRSDAFVDLESTDILLDGKNVERTESRSFIFYKPRGVVTTRSDEKGRKTVFSFFEPLGLYLHAVGRLDFATSGLLILTNDTALSSFLTEPANAIPRKYLVSVKGRLAEEQMKRLEEGVLEGGEMLRPQSVLLRKSSGKESHLTVELVEGKNREIRRVFKAIGHEVTRLKRISFGPFELGTLQPGEYRELSQGEVTAISF